MTIAFEEAGASINALSHISELTGAQVRIFLAEVAEGVSSYRSMHSLTQQVEHQYHGRFLIELLQNAHDAFKDASSGEGNRVEIVFDPADSPYGSLLVANDGQPFSRSNFERLSQLGQSDKDPQKSIGNKGIGFRSVLEVSDCPEVYSRSIATSAVYDGYCFAFRPGVVKSLIEPITELANGSGIPVWSVSGEPLVENWSTNMLAKFLRRVHQHDTGWLAGEINYLSPYLLPVPLSSIESAQVLDFESRGFATVIRLPLKSSDLRTYVVERMKQFSASTVLFLEKVGTLEIKGTGEADRIFTRKDASLGKALAGLHVVISDSTDKPREYALWKRELHVPSAPKEFRKAVEALPGRWPDITDITVSVAVRLGDEPEAGRFSIYLPTLVPTGSAVHINAPFFGDMSRTSIPFDDAYNLQLLETAADISLDVVRNKLAGKGEPEARAILDILAPMGTDKAAERWLNLMDEAALRASASLMEEPLILAENGWLPLNVTSLVPTLPKIIMLTEEVVRRHATFSIFHKCFASRTKQIINFATIKFPNTGAYPLASDLAETIASVALELHKSGGDWNIFWHDVALLLPSGQTELAKYEVLLGNDGALHRASLGKKVFFEPRQGTQDDGDVGSDGMGTEVPLTLRSSVAFLNDQIQAYDPNKPTVQTPVRAYLGSNGFVSQFRVDTIFSDVLQELTPSLPVPIEGPHFALCRDILVWAMRLMGNVLARGRGAEATLKFFRTIPVPCEGGWYPMRETSFGEGWTGTLGEKSKNYLKDQKSIGSKETLQCLLLPPSHPAWGGIGVLEIHLLVLGGVLDGLRLQETKPNSWKSTFQACVTDVRLPGPPPSVSKEQWAQFIAVAQTEAKPPFSTLQHYEVGSIYTFSGFAEFITLPEDARLALSDLILYSLPKWGVGLEALSITKRAGTWNKLEVTSPLKHFLRTTPWMAIRENSGITWACPGERWFVPADVLAGRAKHYAHLKALPTLMAQIVDQRPELAAVLSNLGMPFFDPHSITASSTLLVALTAGVGSNEVSDANVLLGQLRDAWQRFRPTTNQPAMARLAVRRRNKELCVVTPTNESPVYLPDSGAYVAELEDFDFPVLAIGTFDAKNLREWFTTAYGTRIQLTSALSLVPHVNDAPWSGASSVALANSELNWLIRPLLVMVANQSRGVHSSAFKERVELLKMARIDWVPNAKVAVMRGEILLATSEVVALWDSQRRTIVVTERCRTHLNLLSAALAQAIDRDDLELPLRYVLSTVKSVDSPPEDVASFLAPLRISPEQVHQVLEHLRGDIGHMSRLVCMLVRVLCPKASLAGLQEAGTDNELASALGILSLPGVNIEHVFNAARDSQDLFDFGRSVSKDLGQAAALTCWNTALVKLGQPQLRNRGWDIQFQACLEEATALVKMIAAHAIRQGGQQTYQSMLEQYQGLVGKEDISRLYWTIDFNAAMKQVANLVKSWVGDEALILAVESAISVDELREWLLEVPVLLELNPDECGRKNHELVDSVARDIERFRLAAWLKTMANQNDCEWQGCFDDYCNAAADTLSREAFIKEWSASEVFALLRNAVQHPLMPHFQASLLASNDVAALLAALDLSSEELTNAEARLKAIRVEKNHRRSIVKVCGEDFDSSDENLDQLWTFLIDRITGEDIAKRPLLDLGKPTPLFPFNVKSKTNRNVPKAHPKKPQRQSKSVDELIGFAGEIFVFRMLRHKYGEDVVTSSAWVSENSRRVFPFNNANDSMGYDFAFTTKGNLFRVEVKSSAGDDKVFTLGSSEIRLATELGIRSSGKRRREVFILVHVKNALTAQPTAVVLPNPYEPKFAGMFHMVEAEARVRYKEKN